MSVELARQEDPAEREARYAARDQQRRFEH
jgi:hypothetical protein